MWSDTSGLTFQQVHKRARANIVIQFVRGRHNDPYAFDGSGGTLAHAFFPMYGGNAHFDEDEMWSDPANKRGCKSG